MPFSGSGGVWSITAGEYSDGNYPGTQAGYDDAKTHAATLGGKVLLGPTASAPTLGTLAGNVGLIYHDSTGRIRIAKFRVADDTDPTKLLKLDISGITAATQRVITVPNYDGFLPLPAVEGPSNQYLRGAGAGSQPTWATISGAPGGTQYRFYPARIWGDNGVAEVGTTDQEYVAITNYLGTATIDNFTTIIVPGDFSSLISWKLLFATNGTSVNNLVWRFGLAKLTDGSAADGAYTYSDTTVAAPGVVDRLKIVTLTSPAVTMAAGEPWKSVVRRNASGDANDTNADAARFIGTLMTYSS